MKPGKSSISNGDAKHNTKMTMKDSKHRYKGKKQTTSNGTSQPEVRSFLTTEDEGKDISAKRHKQRIDIQLRKDNMFQGKVSGRYPSLILVDSGSSYSLISVSFLNKYKELQALPTINQERSIKLLTASGNTVVCDTAVTIQVHIDHQVIGVTCLLVDNLIGVDIVLGARSLTSLRGSLDFKTGVLRLAKTMIPLKPDKTFILNPGMEKKVLIVGRYIPAYLKNSISIVVSAEKYTDYAPLRMLTQFRNRVTYILMRNNSDKPVKFLRSNAIAYLDTQYATCCFDTVDLIEQNPYGEHIFFLTKDRIPVDNDIQSDTGRGKHKPSSLFERNKRKYPFLLDDDPLLRKTDEQILQEQIDLSESDLTHRQRKHLMDLLKAHKGAFSLRGEIGNCSKVIDFTLSDDKPFYIRPFTVSNEDKPYIDAELLKLKKMGILEEGHTPYSSPILLVSKKNTKDKRLVTDLRYLNSKIEKANHPFPLVKETMQIIGASDCSVISCIDLKEAFHSLKLSDRAQRYCGITSYFGGKSYFYKRLAMGLSISPSKFQEHIDNVLDTIGEDRRTFCLSLMDDLVIFSKDHRTHLEHLSKILEAIESYGLKISPKKTKLFQQKVVYMGHEVLITPTGPAIKPLATRIDAIVALKAPTNKRECRRFCGMVLYLSSFMPKLQELLTPIRKVARATGNFEWKPEQEKAFQEVKSLLVKAPILSMPKSHGKFILYSDTSITGTGSSLWQVQDGQEKLIGYYSKCLPPCCSRYSVSELELFGACLNIAAFKYLLQSNHFQICVDHGSLVQIMKSKNQPPTLRLAKMIEKLSRYSFDFCYRKGKDMHICDFLSRSPNMDDPRPSEVLPIAFPAVTRSQTRKGTAELQKPLHPVEMTTKGSKTSHGEQAPPTQRPRPQPALDPDVAPIAPPHGPLPVEKDPQPEAINANEEMPPAVIGEDPSMSLDGDANAEISQVRDDNQIIPPYVPERKQRSFLNDITYVHPRQPVCKDTLVSDKNIPATSDEPLTNILSKNYKHSPAVIGKDTFETLTKPDQTWYQPSRPIFGASKVTNDSIIRSHITKQRDIEKILDMVRRKVIKDFQLPVDAMQIQRDQFHDPVFGPIYKYIDSGVLPTNPTAMKTIKGKSQDYVLIRRVLFRISPDESAKLQLVIPNKMVPMVFRLYHDSLIGAHQGITRTYKTLRSMYHIHDLYQKIANYVATCHVCQRIKSEPKDNRLYEKRIPIDYSPLRDLHADIKYMPLASNGCRYLLVVSCAITRYVITVPLMSIDAVTIAENILQRIVFIFGIPRSLIFDEDRALGSKIMKYMLTSLGTDLRFISAYNHGSSPVERHIGTISRLIQAKLAETGRSWHLYAQSSAFAFNTFQNVLGYSPYYMVFLQKPLAIPHLELEIDSDVSLSHREYAELLKKRFDYVGKQVLDLQASMQSKQAEAKALTVTKPKAFQDGSLVYVLAPSASSLETHTRKFRCDFVGPFVICSVLSPTHYLLKDLEGKVLKGVFHLNRLKIAYIRTQEGPVSNIAKLRSVMSKSTDTPMTDTPSDPIIITDESLNQIPHTGYCAYSGEVSAKTDLHDFLPHAKQNNGMCILGTMSPKSKIRTILSMSRKPNLGSTLDLVKCRVKNGELQLLLSDKTSKYTCWIDSCDFKEREKLVTSILSDPRIRVTGSFRNFCFHCIP